MTFDLMGNWRKRVTVGHGKASGKHKQGMMVTPLTSGRHVDFDVRPVIPVITESMYGYAYHRRSDNMRHGLPKS